MFIFPADARFSQCRWPLLTLLLVLVNVVVFAAVQSSDGRQWREATQYYFSGDLPGLEFPRYLEDLRRRDEHSAAARLSAALKDHGAEGAVAVLTSLQADEDFLRRLHQGQVIRSEAAEYGSWQAQRRHFDQLLTRIAGLHYALDSAEPRAVTLFSHMFLHGGLSHLFGNMVVLLLVGTLVEFALGAWRYLVLYLLGGLCAAGAYIGIHYGESAKLVGASGAISALMGAFAVLYGWRRVRFFYTIVFYFDFIRLPALALLPYWLAWEALQLAIDRGSHVAYEAHFGGLVGGALLALLRRLTPAEVPANLDQPEQTERRERELRQALDLMGRLEFVRARGLFERLHAEQPEDLRPLLQLFRIAKSEPVSATFHRYAALLFAAKLPSAQTDEIFDSYWSLARPAPQLETETMLRLLNRYAVAADYRRADALIAALLRQGCRDRALAAVVGVLAQRSPAEQAARYRELLGRLQPA